MQSQAPQKFIKKGDVLAEEAQQSQAEGNAPTAISQQLDRISDLLGQASAALASDEAAEVRRTAQELERSRQAERARELKQKEKEEEEQRHRAEQDRIRDEEAKNVELVIQAA